MLKQGKNRRKGKKKVKQLYCLYISLIIMFIHIEKVALAFY